MRSAEPMEENGSSLLEQPQGDHPKGLSHTNHGSDRAIPPPAKPKPKPKKKEKDKPSCVEDLLGTRNKPVIGDGHIEASSYRGGADHAESFGLGTMWRSRIDNVLHPAWCSGEIYKEGVAGTSRNMSAAGGTEDIYMSQGKELYLQWNLNKPRMITVLEVGGWHNASELGAALFANATNASNSSLPTRPPNIYVPAQHHYLIQKFKLKYKALAVEQQKHSTEAGEPVSADAGWRWYNDGEVLQGVTESWSTVKVPLMPFKARLIRLYPTVCGSGVHCCARVGLWGCDPPLPKPDEQEVIIRKGLAMKEACAKVVQPMHFLCVLGFGLLLSMATYFYLKSSIDDLRPVEENKDKLEEKQRSVEETLTF